MAAHSFAFVTEETTSCLFCDRDYWREVSKKKYNMGIKEMSAEWMSGKVYFWPWGKTSKQKYFFFFFVFSLSLLFFGILSISFPGTAHTERTSVHLSGSSRILQRYCNNIVYVSVTASQTSARQMRKLNLLRRTPRSCQMSKKSVGQLKVNAVHLTVYK